MTFVADGTDSITLTNFAVAPTFTGSSPAGPAATGAPPQFNLGDFDNFDQDPDTERVTIEFNALVCNVASNVNAAQRDNYATASISGNVVANV